MPAYDPASPAETRRLLNAIGQSPNRTLGQNFLINRHYLDRIVQAAGVSQGASVLEIGPGLGALTCRLDEARARVTAVEKDPGFISILRENLPRVHIVAGDALRVEWGDLRLPETGVRVVANLPYSISKPMLRRLLEEWRPHVQDMTLMLQREVACRLLALPGSADYGPLALMTALYAEAKKLFDVPPGNFLPPPKVMSTVVQLRLRENPACTLADENLFWRLVQAGFAQRRKQLGNTLTPVTGSRERAQALLLASGIDPARRGETLHLNEWALLTEVWCHAG